MHTTNSLMNSPHRGIGAGAGTQAASGDRSDGPSHARQFTFIQYIDSDGPTPGPPDHVPKPLRALFEAVLDSALRDLRSPNDVLRRNAEVWFSDLHADDCMSVSVVATTLSIDPAALAARVASGELITVGVRQRGGRERGT